MNNQPLNLEAVETYSRTFARKTADAFFAGQNYITGKEIMSFCEIVQVNLFVLDKLFATWQKEAARLQSPYFDYEAPEVKEGLEQFMNTLSRYIKVSRSHFEPLLTAAATDALCLALTPYAFYEELFEQVASQPVGVNGLKEKLKFFRTNKFLFQEVLNQFETQGIEEVSVENLKIVFDGVYASRKDQLEPPEATIELFSNHIPLKPADLFFTPAPAKPQPAPPQVQQSFWVDIEQFAMAANQPQVPRPTVTDPKPVTPVMEATPVPPPAPVATPPKPVHHEPVKADPVVKVEPVQPVVKPAEPVKPVVTSLNEVLNQEKETLNDRFRTSVNKPFVEKVAKQRIDNLQAAIPLHQKFMFVKGLFKGDNTAFQQALNELDRCSDYPAAITMLEEKYAKFYAWNPASEEVKTFLDLVERRYL